MIKVMTSRLTIHSAYKQTTYCFFRELASVRGAAGRDKAFPTMLLAPIQPKAVLRPGKSMSEVPPSRFSQVKSVYHNTGMIGLYLSL